MTPEELALLQQQQYADRAAAQAQAQQQAAPVSTPSPDVQQFAQGKADANTGNPPVRNLFADRKPAFAGTMINVDPRNNTIPRLSVTTPSTPARQTYTAPQKKVDPNSSTDGMDLISSMYTSPQEEERRRKASLASQRIMAVGDALRHIGNIYNTVHYAPSQQFTTPVAEESERYQKGKALRDAANMRYLSYQQQKAAQDRAMAKMAMDMKYKNDLMQHYRDQEQRLRDKDAAAKENQEARRDLDREKFELDKAYKQGRLSVSQYAAETARIRAVKSGRAGGGGGKYWAYDQEGKIHYYPNRTMWEQGVYQFNPGMHTETFENTNANGETSYRQSGEKTTSIGGRAAREASGGGKNSKKNPYGDNTKNNNNTQNHKKNPYG